MSEPAAAERTDFFVSYTGADRAWAEWVAWQLEDAGYTTVIQAWDFRPGSEFMVDMQQALLTTRRVIAVLSRAYLDAPYARQEWNAALADDPSGEKGKLLPVRVEEVRPEGLDAARVYLDLVGLDEPAARQRLLAGVVDARVKPARSPEFPGTTAAAPPTAPAPAPAFPGRRPKVWNAQRRNLNFTGRLADLEAIRARASGDPSPGPVVQALHGLGGVGKSQVALEYAHRYAADYDIVWWVRSQLPGDAARDLAQLAGPLGVAAQPTQSETATLVAEELAGRSRWLLVFDYADGPDDLRDFQPSDGGGLVLITSRNRAWGAVARPVAVRELTRDESVAFLLRRLHRESTAEAAAAAELAEELGDLPLMLEYAAAYMEDASLSIDRYLELFRRRREQLVASSDPTQDGDTLATTWRLSFEQVERHSPVGVPLLRLLGYLCSDDIPLDLLRDGIDALPASLREAVRDEIELEDALRYLVKYSLVDREGDVLRLHRLVQAVVRGSLTPEQRGLFAGAAIRLLQAAFPAKPQRPDTWERCAQLVPHVLVASRRAEECQVEIEATVGLLRQAGVYLASYVQLAAAETVLQRALALAESWGGAGHPLVAEVLAVLGNVDRELGRLADGRAYLERALGIEEQNFGADSAEVVPALSRLGHMLNRQGKLADAQVHLERALEICRAHDIGGPRLSSVLRALGCILWDRRDLPRAEACFREALELDRSLWGDDHPKVSTSLNYLGGVTRDLGDLETATAMIGQALAIDRAAYGDEHPRVAARLNNLAGVVRRQGDMAEARRL
ncbi:MAG: hypothetical protein QOI99_128, partial [Actinomycetota bacterium]|nr:hypothetical protein [Actinomycetota bacterium]